MEERSQKVALVTGGASGIGWAICARLAAEGYRVALADLDQKTASARVDQLGGDHAAFPVDLTDAAGVRALPGLVLKAMGRLDLVVNNAGMTDSTGRGIIALPEASFDRLVALNLVAVENICEASAQLLPTGGRIVNLSSGAAYRPLALRGPYSATKAAVTALTAALNADLAPRGIRVSAVAPGYTLTPLVQALADAGRVDLEAVARDIPLGRVAQPEDIAAAVAFLASPEGAGLGGQTLPVDGGGLMGAAPEDAGPRPGTSEQGATLLLANAPLPGLSAATSTGETLGTGPLQSVVDARGLEPTSGQLALDRLRRLAASCADHAARTQDFSLLIVSAQGQSPAERAAAAASSMLARTLALEWAPAGIRVNALTWRGAPSPALGHLCRFLTSREAAQITGQALDGGSPPAALT